MRNLWYPVLLILLLPTLCSAASFGNRNPDRDIMIHIETVPVAWADGNLQQRVVGAFTRRDNVRIYPVSQLSKGLPQFPRDHYHLDSLTNWGTEVGARYLIVMHVEKEGLERRKRVRIPLVLHKYVTMGVIEGELRVLDVSRERLLIAEPFRVELEGPEIFQATMDDDIYDPDLHIRASDKTSFFRHLEEHFAEVMAERIGKVIRMR